MSIIPQKKKNPHKASGNNKNNKKDKDNKLIMPQKNSHKASRKASNIIKHTHINTIYQSTVNELPQMNNLSRVK